MEDKKMKEWTCPQCKMKNPITQTTCKVCGYSIEDQYTLEELEDMSLSKANSEKNTILFQILGITIATAYSLRLIYKTVKGVKFIVNKLK